MVKMFVRVVPLAALMLGCLSSQQSKDRPRYICEEREITGSHVPRPMCRPMTKSEVQEIHDKETLRRAQQQDQMRQQPGGK